MSTPSNFTESPECATPAQPHTSSAACHWTLVVVNTLLGAGVGLLLGLIVGVVTGLIPFSC